MGPPAGETCPEIFRVMGVPAWSEAKVHPDHHIAVARSLYSVPTRYVGKTVRVRRDQKTVRVFVGAELIKLHPRVEPGKRSTDVADYPKGKGDAWLRCHLGQVLGRPGP